MLKWTCLTGVALGALAAAIPACAADMDAASTISAVTVYPDGAIVTRTLPVDLPKGTTTLVLKSLPLTIDPASMRVDGLANGQLTIGSVESRLQATDPNRAEPRQTEIRNVREEIGRIAAGLDALEGRKAMIQRFAQAGPERAEKSALAVSDWGAAWGVVGEALAKVNEEIRVAQLARADADARLKALEAAETARRSRTAPEREFTIALDAEAALKGKLTLQYRVIGASWRPAYDARLTTAEGGKSGGLVLQRRALVTQRTGEDWTNVELSLSTTRTARGTAAPEVEPQRVTYFEPAPPPILRQRSEVARPTAAAPAPAASDMAFGAGEARKVAVSEATLETNGYQASYRLPGSLTVPTDGTQKSLVIQSRNLQPELSVKAAPALDPTAYLQAAFSNDDDAPLLPGDVSLIRDNSYIGRGRLAFTAPGEKVALGFGADDRIKIARVPLRRRETDPTLLSSTKSDTRDFKITVKNLHAFAIKTTIVDQIPFSELANLTVDALSSNTPATEKAPQDKRGVLSWTYDLKPGEEREIRIGYRMRWPADRDVTFERAPNGN